MSSLIYLSSDSPIETDPEHESSSGGELESNSDGEHESSSDGEFLLLASRRRDAPRRRVRNALVPRAAYVRGRFNVNADLADAAHVRYFYR
jgi:hypothetical protein